MSTHSFVSSRSAFPVLAWDEKHNEVKFITKMGICWNPSRSLPDMVRKQHAVKCCITLNVVQLITVHENAKWMTGRSTKSSATILQLRKLSLMPRSDCPTCETPEKAAKNQASSAFKEAEDVLGEQLGGLWSYVR
jgi:hypothetical protein